MNFSYHFFKSSTLCIALSSCAFLQAHDICQKLRDNNEVQQLCGELAAQKNALENMRAKHAKKREAAIELRGECVDEEEFAAQQIQHEKEQGEIVATISTLVAKLDVIGALEADATSNYKQSAE